jgi:EAL domain-containing protein (putative c-di-GMP-specific phosphodiesterase class I)
MSLIRNINIDVIKQSIVQVICDLSKRIESRLIAEGIETEEEYNTLLSIGVEYAQGYLFAKPAEYA